MKRLIFILLAVALASAAHAASSWDFLDNTGAGLVTEDSLSTKKIIATTTTGDSVLIYSTADQPKVVFSTNGTSKDSIYHDGTDIWLSGIFRTGSHIYPGGAVYPSGNLTFYQYAAASISHGRDYAMYIYSNVGQGYKTIIGYPDSTKSLVVDTNRLVLKSSATALGKNNYWQWNYSKDAPAMLVSDSTASGARTTDSLYYDGGALWGTMPFKLPYIAVAKDTTLEIALFTRTCTRDTLTYMTGADSLTAAYIVSPFGTRGAITCPPYVAGVVDGKLVIDRPAADTASYDRYSVTRIIQR